MPAKRQIDAIERKRAEQLECGEIETAHPGCLGSQDTFYVGNMKGVAGAISRPSLIHASRWLSRNATRPRRRLSRQICSMIASCRSTRSIRYRYFECEQIAARKYGVKIERHDYQLHLPVRDVDHTRTKAQSPQTNGICEGFHKAILNESYQVAFRKEVYPRSNRCRRILTRGSTRTTMNARIKEKCAADERRWRRSKRARICREKLIA